MVAHVQAALGIHQSDQLPTDDAATGIATRDDTAGLPVVEHHLGRDLAIGGVANRDSGDRGG